MERQQTEKLIIFDCDGVLVDSEPLSNAVIAQQLQDLGFPMTTEEAIHHFAGTSLKKVRAFAEEKGVVWPSDFEQVYRQRSYAMFKEALQPVAGIEAAISKLPYRKCVASNGPLEKVKLNLSITKLIHHFPAQNLFSAYELQRWKPDPALYLHAAATLGVSPEHCLVVEDSHHGVTAALAAGMRVFAYTGRTPEEHFSTSEVPTFSEMSALPALVEALDW